MLYRRPRDDVSRRAVPCSRSRIEYGVCANNDIVRAIVLLLPRKGDPLGDSPLAAKGVIAIPPYP